MRLLLRFLAWLDLPANHRLGAFAGRLVFALSPRYRLRTLENLRVGGRSPPAARPLAAFARENAAEIGKGAAELAWALYRPVEEVAGLVKELDGWEAVERLRAGGRPLIFVTPHLGGYDIAGRYLWSRLPIMAMYRPHKLGWLDEVIREGRNRGAAPDGSNVAPANMAGVRMLLRHLKQGRLHRDPAGPGAGRGRGRMGRLLRPARLHDDAHGPAAGVLGRRARVLLRRAAGGTARASGCACARARSPCRRTGPRPPAPSTDGVEELVRLAPAQYLWGYNRYKRPAGAPPAPGTIAWPGKP